MACFLPLCVLLDKAIIQIIFFHQEICAFTMHEAAYQLATQRQSVLHYLHKTTSDAQ